MDDEAEMLYGKRFDTQSHGDPEGLLEFVKRCIRAPIDHLIDLSGLRIEEAHAKLTRK
jgi:hypothetical protein